MNATRLAAILLSVGALGLVIGELDFSIATEAGGENSKEAPEAKRKNNGSSEPEEDKSLENEPATQTAFSGTAGTGETNQEELMTKADLIVSDKTTATQSRPPPVASTSPETKDSTENNPMAMTSSTAPKETGASPRGSTTTSSGAVEGDSEAQPLLRPIIRDAAITIIVAHGLLIVGICLVSCFYLEFKKPEGADADPEAVDSEPTGTEPVGAESMDSKPPSSSSTSSSESEDEIESDKIRIERGDGPLRASAGGSSTFRRRPIGKKCPKLKNARDRGKTSR